MRVDFSRLSTVFISYAKSDREQAYRVCDLLEVLGYRCWIAPRDVRTGHEYGEEIIRGIENSSRFVLLLSAAANGSRYVNREVERAVSKSKPVFPLCIENVVPTGGLEFHLASLQLLDAWSGSLEDHIKQLARDLADDPRAHMPADTVRAKPRRGRAVVFALLALGVGVLVTAGSATGLRLQFWAQPQAVVSLSGMRSDTHPYPLTQCYAHSGPVLSCMLEGGARARVYAPTGERFTVGDGVPGEVFVPWLGPGTVVRIETSAGEQDALVPSLENQPNAMLVAPRDDTSPLLAYTLREQGETLWFFLFFAPREAQDVEWSTDARGFVRAPREGWQRGSPFWIPAQDPHGKKISIRWRSTGGQWSVPADYVFDADKLRAALVARVADPAMSVGCYRSPHLPVTRCYVTGNYPLGELFDHLRWGATPERFTDVDTFEFERFKTEIRRSLPSQPTCDLSVQSCADTWNTYSARLDVVDREITQSLPPPSWKVVGSGQDFIILNELLDDVYFSAVPRGGGEPVIARIPVARSR